MYGRASSVRALLAVLFCLICGVAYAGQKDPKTAYDHYLSGNELCRDGRHGEAISAFRKSLALNPKYYYARVNLGTVLAQSGQFDKAVGEFTSCINRKWGGIPDRFACHLNRALALEAAGKTEAARKDRTTLRRLDPVHARQLEGSTDYVLMDLTYMEKRNLADKTRLFNKSKAKIMRGDVVIHAIANIGANEQEHEVIGLVDGTLDQVFAVLADYRNYPKFMPNVKEIVIRSSSDGATVVDHELSLPMGYVKKYRLKFRSKSEQGRRQLVWKKLPWPGVKDKQTVVDTYGQWILEELPGVDGKVLAYYRVFTDTGKIPFGTGWIVEPMTKKSFQGIFKGTRRRVKDVHH